MIEIPESIVLAGQLNDSICGKRIKNVIVENSPHKFAWYYGDLRAYYDLLKDKVITKVSGFCTYVEIKADDVTVLLGEGVSIRYIKENMKRPDKHQLLIEFDDSSVITASIQMYGGLWCFKEGNFDNKYYFLAMEKPSPLTKGFDDDYFYKIVNDPNVERLSVKALLATEQRIPGLGNGVLQDILFNAKIHPKRKTKTLTVEEKISLFKSIKSTLHEMTINGGRDTEKDIFGCSGGYKTKLGKNTLDKPCSVCGSIIKKEAYLGGSIYYCPSCQEL